MTTFRELLLILTTFSEVSEKQTQKTLELNVPVELSLASGGRGSGAHAPQQLTLTVVEDDWVKVRGTAHKFGDSTKPHQPVVSEGWWG